MGYPRIASGDGGGGSWIWIWRFKRRGWVRVLRGAEGDKPDADEEVLQNG